MPRVGGHRRVGVDGPVIRISRARAQDEEDQRHACAVERRALSRELDEGAVDRCEVRYAKRKIGVHDDSHDGFLESE